MAAETIDDKPAVYLVSETPDTLDKPVFDFSSVSYTDGRAMNTLNVRIHQKNKELADAQNAVSFEALADQLEDLIKDQKSHVATHGKENKILAQRIRRIETRLENWTDEPSNIEDLMAQVNTLLNEQESNILAGVTYLPQSWLIKGAPLASSIDWSDHSNLKYLRMDKFQTVARAKRDAQNDSPN